MATRTAPTSSQARSALLSGATALGLGACLVWLLNHYGVGGGHALFFGLAPDLAFLLSIDPRLAHGQLHPRAVGLYNALHSPFAPMALAIPAALNLFGLDLAWFVGALAWAIHIATDRALGFGPRTHDGFQRG